MQTFTLFHFITSKLDADYQTSKDSLLLLLIKPCAPGSFSSWTKLAVIAHLPILCIYKSPLAHPIALLACFNANEHTEPLFIGKADLFCHESPICPRIHVFLINITSYKQTAIPQISQKDVMHAAALATVTQL